MNALGLVAPMCLAALLSACSRGAPSTATSNVVDAGTPGSLADAALGSVRAIDARAATPVMSQLTVADRLDHERTARSASATPKVEEVFAALERAGVETRDKRQHLASPMGAMYCEGAVSTAGDLAVSVCEYEGDDAARAGRETSFEAFARVPNREVYVRRATTLTLMQPTVTAESATVVKRAVDSFQRL